MDMFCTDATTCVTLNLMSGIAGLLVSPSGRFDHCDKDQDPREFGKFQKRLYLIWNNSIFDALSVVNTRKISELKILKFSLSGCLCVMASSSFLFQLWTPIGTPNSNRIGMVAAWLGWRMKEADANAEQTGLFEFPTRNLHRGKQSAITSTPFLYNLQFIILI